MPHCFYTVMIVLKRNSPYFFAIFGLVREKTHKFEKLFDCSMSCASTTADLIELIPMFVNCGL